jgi:ABC-2 type transport system permease protein
VAALVVPSDFSRRLLAGEAVRLTIVVDDKTPAGASARDAVRGALARVYGAAEAARVRADAQAAELPFADDAARVAALDDLAGQALRAWATPPLAVALEPVGAAPIKGTPDSFRQSSPGMMVMFALFSLVLSASVLVAERRSGTLARLLSTSVGRTEVILGHLLAMFAVVFGQGLLLIIVGQFGFGVDYLRNPLATLLVVAALALWVAALGLLIGLLAKGPEQVSLFGLIAMFVLSALGGAWFPTEGASKEFAAVGHLLPSAWAMDGLQNVVVRGLATDAVMLPVVVMLAYAAGFSGLAIWRFRLGE